jgi:adenylate cyclase
MAEFTVVFADLTGSTSIFESLGNVKATQAISSLTRMIGQVCEKHNGRVVKFLGDGVLILFINSHEAIEATSELQQVHNERVQHWPSTYKMQLQIGITRGDVLEQNGDCYGDAVNLASRLSELSGSDQILVSDSVVQHLPAAFINCSRCLGAMIIRGRNESCVVHRVDWKPDVLNEAFTVPASLMSASTTKRESSAAIIKLSWLERAVRLTAIELPILIGRDQDAQLVLHDPRVSRQHAIIEWRADKFYLKDVSSYGTWVMFSNSNSIVALRRQECVLLHDGIISLGAPFEDLRVPTVNFSFN